ncbi:MAG: DUF488 domain-containing protein [Chloroflexi bacterium]|jgi:uncharacterized protein (DUF488 family)|nr:MAG: DUF488 domain-containing protein [Chloroflexota bacterium]
MPLMKPSIWSIGHSTGSIENLLSLLQRAGINAVADVRSAPFSSRMPWFNQESLAASLKTAGIEYQWLGVQLGGRPADPAHYDDEGHALYGLMAETSPFEMGIERIERAAEKYQLSLLCSEEDPVDCHRNTFVGKVLRDRGVVSLVHLRHREPYVESDDHLLQRLTPSQRHLRSDPLFPDLRPTWRSTHSLRKPWPTEGGEDGE